MNESELLSDIDALLKKYYSQKNEIFIPGETQIPLASRLDR